MTAIEGIVLLSPAEQTRLIDLEVAIDKGMRTFVEVGQALAEIRDSGLYRDGHATFEDYCAKRWNLDKPHAYRLIVASEISAGLVPMGTTTPSSERVARELAPLRETPERMREAWAEAVSVSEGKPTAKDVREVVQQFVEPKAPNPTTEDPRASAIRACRRRSSSSHTA